MLKFGHDFIHNIVDITTSFYLGIYKGFYDMKQLGLIDRLPKLIAVQAEGCAAIVNAMKTGKFEQVAANTIADSISVGIPRNRLKAMRA